LYHYILPLDIYFVTHFWPTSFQISAISISMILLLIVLSTYYYLITQGFATATASVPVATGFSFQPHTHAALQMPAVVRLLMLYQRWLARSRHSRRSVGVELRVAAAALPHRR
jgi:hypothetical protein